MEQINRPKRKIFFSYQREEDRIFGDYLAYMIEADEVGKSLEESDIRDYKSGYVVDEKKDFKKNFMGKYRRDYKRENKSVCQKIRDDLIADAEVTIVLLNPCTWQSRLVDWEIAASFTDTENRARCGLWGLILPHHPDFKGSVHPHRMPPRMAMNYDIPYAHSYVQYFSWPYNHKTEDEVRQLMSNPQEAEKERQERLQPESKFPFMRGPHDLSVTHDVIRRIDEAYLRSKKEKPDNRIEPFRVDKKGHCFEGWNEWMIY